jgi:hypothetical protein
MTAAPQRDSDRAASRWQKFITFVLLRVRPLTRDPERMPLPQRPSIVRICHPLRGQEIAIHEL